VLPAIGDRMDNIKPFIEPLPSGFGTLSSVSHAAVLSNTPARWSRPAMPLGSHLPEFPAPEFPG